MVEEGVVKVVMVEEHSGHHMGNLVAMVVGTIMVATVRMVAMDTPLPMAAPLVVDLTALQVMIKEVSAWR